MTLEEIRTQLTIDIPTTARALGVSNDNAYAAAKAGTIPTLKLGRRIVVPVPALLALLGERPQ